MIRDVAIGGLQVAILLFAVFGFVDAVGWRVLQREWRRDGYRAPPGPRPAPPTTHGRWRP